MSNETMSKELSEVVSKYLPSAMAGEMLKYLNDCKKLQIELEDLKLVHADAIKELKELKELKLSSKDIDKKLELYREYERRVDAKEIDLQDRLRKYTLEVENLKLKAKYEAGIEAQQTLNVLVSNMFQNVNVVATKKS